MNARSRGFTLLEAMAAAAVAGAMLTLSLQMLASMATQRRATQRREAALQEAANLTERLAVLPWDDLTADRLAGLTLSPHAQQILPGGKLKVNLAETGDAAHAKRLSVEVHWLNRAGEEESPVRLTWWIYQRDRR